ncbi:Coenzyme F420 hydrogenase/dehydrogenase, beta subunit C-terminal domain [Escherichia coli]|uniref:Coenzyme F420 hydrogenase/dehydrogenase, beta subunit C-terminal domain n=1 Tax=Escherichia coli TaxID=562 RepID=UPI001DBBFBD7|nr:Coenzyme F420 hydrogenase/dehydrogenase, beta subunit C-terminal domain [Escherichia coli]EEW1187995.1 coenzyme F420 hydrogenase [Escherichia coli]EHE9923362.1 coenzyme F420 hydrogenase [Escherichia coli]EHK5557313.1 Coenzyme F420 hydrogenase/dehydrogenase, beta subunit C-terminal domain [Escherichia coli]EHK7432417.1 Coenzyme F420 hydrogenase/dehydrogenase, beta subunit C-terminal domain [Escherichia coli]EHP6191369.1 Coenzyme F420 hydrogenase/dehydrogenase, beta subunit C-terminal domain 
MVIRNPEKKNEITIKDVIDNELCTGCGVCISEDSSKTSFMKWNSEGFYEPCFSPVSTLFNMQRVCPFNLSRDTLVNEDELAHEFFDGKGYLDSEVGFYKKIYVGYSKHFRETSSSGGIATYVFEQLLRRKYVDALFIVRELGGSYGYQVFDNPEHIKDMSKTRYYPVTLEKLFDNIYKLNGRVAVSGVACFIKAIRLKQHYHPELKEKIPFLVGIICGGLKSRYYTDYLSQSAGCVSEYQNAEYRVKKKDSHALDYRFTCVEKSNNIIHSVDMQRMGDMWGSGLFKANACDYCDDVTTELADISLGDAWISPYNMDGAGNNVVVCRSTTAHEIILSGIEKKDLELTELELEQLKLSQQGSFNHRHKGLLYRIKNAEKNNRLVPVKRKRFLRSISFLLKLIQKQRSVTRRKSIEIWMETQNSATFDKKMKGYLFTLRWLTVVNRKLSRMFKIVSLNRMGKK